MACLLESCGGPIPPAIYAVRCSPDHDSLFNLPASCRGGLAPNQTLDGLLSTMRYLGLPGVRTGGVAELA